MTAVNPDYSFMDPTWKLPPVGNPSMYPGSTYDPSLAPPQPNVDSDMPSWNNTTTNPRYNPSNTNRGNYPSVTNQESGQNFVQPGASVQPFQQPDQRFLHPGPPPPPAPQFYHQPDEHFMQPRNAQSYQQVTERPMQSGPPVPVAQSYQQSGKRFIPPGPPPSQSYQPPNNPNRNNGNYNDSFDFTIDVNSNDEYNMPQQARNNGYPNEPSVHRGHNFPVIPQPTQKRTQPPDHHQQTFFTDYAPSRDGHHSHHSPPIVSNHFDKKSKPHSKPIHDNDLDLVHSSMQRPNNFNIHEYLYGLSTADAGSYVNTYKNQRRRLQDEKVNHKSVMSEYKSFLQNGGFGPAFGKTTHQTYEEKLDTEKKKKSYSKLVRQINQQKIEDQKRFHNSGGQAQNRANAAPPLRHQRPEQLPSHLLFTPEVKEFERKIKREHDANCKCSLHAKPFKSSA